MDVMRGEWLKDMMGEVVRRNGVGKGMQYMREEVGNIRWGRQER